MPSRYRPLFSGFNVGANVLDAPRGNASPKRSYRLRVAPGFHSGPPCRSAYRNYCGNRRFRIRPTDDLRQMQKASFRKVAHFGLLLSRLGHYWPTGAIYIFFLDEIEASNPEVIFWISQRSSSRALIHLAFSRQWLKLIKKGARLTPCTIPTNPRLQKTAGRCGKSQRYSLCLALPWLVWCTSLR